MALDATCLSAVVGELHTNLEGARVDKITQPDRDEIILHLRARELGNVKLLLCTRASSSRLHLTQVNKENPATPPMFCMLLRKHLGGARLLAIKQVNNDRLVSLTFTGRDELGDETVRVLLSELIARSANLFFLDADNVILSSMRSTGGDIMSARPNLPGTAYILPPKPDLMGLSPLLRREKEYRGEAFTQLLERKEFAPYMFFEGGNPVDFSCVDIQQHGDKWQVETRNTFSQLLDEFYARTAGNLTIERKKTPLIKTIQTKLARVARKLEAQKLELEFAVDRDMWLRRGELLKANMHLAHKGATSIEVDDYYCEDVSKLTIQLDPLLSAQQNAAKFFKKYTKAKTAEKVLGEQIQLGEQELAYWQSVHESILRCGSERELADIRAELNPEKSIVKGKKRPEQSKPHMFISSSGLRIFAGRNNLQNETLTLKTAQKNDIWLHAQKIAGAHVIVELNGKSIDDNTLHEAAVIAATLSAAKNGVKVPVDYTLVRHVKKIPRSKPGMVNYEQFKTVYVDADVAVLEK